MKNPVSLFTFDGDLVLSSVGVSEDLDMNGHLAHGVVHPGACQSGETAGSSMSLFNFRKHELRLTEQTDTHTHTHKPPVLHSPPPAQTQCLSQAEFSPACSNTEWTEPDCFLFSRRTRREPDPAVCVCVYSVTTGQSSYEWALILITAVTVQCISRNQLSLFKATANEQGPSLNSVIG